MIQKISICMGSSCFARGNNRHLELIEGFLAENGLVAQVELSGCRCENKCSLGPNLSIDGKLYQGLDQGQLMDLLREGFKN